jgi:hypothetical protein
MQNTGTLYITEHEGKRNAYSRKVETPCCQPSISMYMKRKMRYKKHSRPNPAVKSTRWGLCAYRVLLLDPCRIQAA